MTDFIYKNTNQNRGEFTSLIDTLDAEAMIEATNATYYGGEAVAEEGESPIEARIRGYNHFFGRERTGEPVELTDDTPATVWVRQFPHSVADWEENFSDKLTFAQYAQGILDLQLKAEEGLRLSREEDFKGSTKFAKGGDASKLSNDGVNQVLNAFYVDPLVADEVALLTLNALLGGDPLKAIGPRPRSGSAGLTTISGAQLLAAASGAIDYRPAGRQGLRSTAPFPETDSKGFFTNGSKRVNVRGISHDWDKRAKKPSNIPARSGAWIDDIDVQNQAIDIVKRALAMAISVFGFVAKANSGLEEGEAPEVTGFAGLERVGQYMASALDTLAQTTGLSPAAAEALKKARGGDKGVAARLRAVDGFWSWWFGYDGAPDGTFGGLLPKFPYYCEGALTRALTSGHKLAKGFRGDKTPLLTSKTYVDDNGQLLSYHVLPLDDKFWETVDDAGLVNISTLSTWRVRQFFPSLPMAGECGGVISTKPTRRRSNHLIKHSRLGTVQERADSVGARFLVAAQVIQATSLTLTDEDTDLVDSIDIDNL